MQKKTLGQKRILQFNVYVGHIDEKDVEEYLNRAKLRNPLEEFEDLVCVYFPVRDEVLNNQIIRIL